MTSFQQLALIEPLQRAVRDAGYTTPTPIQLQAIPHLLEGRDLLGCAKTGTGKTAAFSLPILQRLAAAPRKATPRRPRVLVLTPTRELAAQVAESFETYGAHLRIAVAVIYGGVGQAPQVRALERGVDVLVACPGRLVDLMGQGHVRLDQVETLVLDEADHMLDLGFLPDVKRVLAAVPRKRQTLFFSATMPPEISKLADTILTSPVKVMVTPPASTVELVTQRVMFLSRTEKPGALTNLLRDASVGRAIVFTRTKRGADRVAKRLNQDGVASQAIHGNKSQNNRERTLDGFRDGRLRVLVATDIAARGIDIDDITHVVNYELPNVPETYVHRIGRTGRAGASGLAISLCDDEEREYLRDIEKLTKRSIEVLGRAAGSRSGPPARSTQQERSSPSQRSRENAPAERASTRATRHSTSERRAPERGTGQRSSSQRGAQQRTTSGRTTSERTSTERSTQSRPERSSRPAAEHRHAPARPRHLAPVGAANSASRPAAPPRERHADDFGAGV